MIIGLMGFKQVGKSTAAKHLEEKHGFIRINFKDALVQELKDNFPDLLVELSQSYHMDIDKLFENKPPAMRALMQNYGTDCRRKDDRNYWVKQWAMKCLDAINKGKNIVVDDVRFRNEAQCVKANRGHIIHLTRPDVETGGTHSSETEMSTIKADFTVPSLKGEHEVLYYELDKIVEEIK